MYKAFYRKWRPKVFEDIVGQDHITITLKNQIKTGKITHSYLLTGSRGIGKTTIAKVFAKAINCLSNEDGNPCGECKSCIDFENGSLTDIVEMDAASNNGVDDIRELREEAVFLPATSKYRIYIIDETHMLSKGAFNALLKIMEEPPKHVVFILATTEINKVPPTIISRCQRYDFFRVNPLEISKVIMGISKKENISILEDVALNIGVIANGSVRDAISLFDQSASLGKSITQELVNTQAGTANNMQITALADYIIDKNIKKILISIDELYKTSIDIKNISKGLIIYFRNMMLIKELDDTKDIIYISEIEKNNLKLQSEKMNLSEILYLIETLSKIHPSLTGDIESKAFFESTIIKLTDYKLDNSMQSLIQRVKKMEEIINSGEIKNETSTKKEIEEKPLVEEIDDNLHFKETLELSEELEFLEIQKIKEELKIENIDTKEIENIDTEEIENIDTEEIENIDTKEIENIDTKEIENIDIKEIENMDTEVNSKILEEEKIEEVILQVDRELLQWSEILDYLKIKNPPLFATLEGSKAFVKEDFLLIDAPNTVFFDLMRASEATKESLRNAIEAITGRQYKLGPVKKGARVEEEQNVNMLETLKETALNQGIDVIER